MGVREATVEHWEEIASNPDPNEDLGYELQPLTVIAVGKHDEQCMVLPNDSDYLKDDEFLVADPDLICDLHEHR